MGLFGFKKKREKIVDLRDVPLRGTNAGLSTQARKLSEGVYGKSYAVESDEDSSNFLNSIAGASSSSSNYSESGTVGEINERREKLAKRLMDMTEKIEELGNQIYHLQQRMELIEKKLRISNFD